MQSVHSQAASAFQSLVKESARPMSPALRIGLRALVTTVLLLIETSSTQSTALPRILTSMTELLSEVPPLQLSSIASSDIAACIAPLLKFVRQCFNSNQAATYQLAKQTLLSFGIAAGSVRELLVVANAMLEQQSRSVNILLTGSSELLPALTILAEYSVSSSTALTAAFSPSVSADASTSPATTAAPPIITSPRRHHRHEEREEKSEAPRSDSRSASGAAAAAAALSPAVLTPSSSTLTSLPDSMHKYLRTQGRF